jgi:hypothetical protein
MGMALCRCYDGLTFIFAPVNVTLHTFTFAIHVTINAVTLAI